MSRPHPRRRHPLAALITALGLATAAAAAMEDHPRGLGFVRAVVVRDVVVVARDGSSACGELDDSLSSCDAAGAFATSAPIGAMEKCMCGAGMADQYSSCAVYIDSAAPTETDAFTVASEAWELCLGAGGRGGVTATAEPVATGTSAADGGSSGDNTVPAACVSFFDLYSSCSSATPALETAAPSDVAACFCYDKSGTFNTDFDDNASECADYIRTADPTDYSVMTALETFCGLFEPGATTDAAGSTVTTLPAGSSGGGLGGLGSLAGGGGSSSSGGGSSSSGGGSSSSGSTAAGAKTTEKAGANAMSPASWVGLFVGVAAVAVGML